MFLLIAGKLLTILVMKTILSYPLLIFCMFLPALGNAQLILVTGSIINEKTGAALENVNILEAYTGIGTITNISGFFSLMLKPGNAEIVVTYDGFKDLSKKMVLNSDTTLTVSLAPLLNLKTKPKDSEQQKTADKIEKQN
jgi:hypothetical protein